MQNTSNINSNSYDFMDKGNRYDFHTIPMLKFFFMSWVTCGLWNMRWAYKIWKKVAVDYNREISPFWRSGFQFIFNFPLYKIIEKHANSHGIKFDVSSTWLAVMFILVGLLPSFKNSVLEIITFILLFTPSAYIQYKINEVNKKAYPDAFVEEWNIMDTIWAIIGIFFRGSAKIITKIISKY